MFTKRERPKSSDTYISLHRESQKKVSLSAPSSPYPSAVAAPAPPTTPSRFDREEVEFIKDTGVPLPEEKAREFFSLKNQYRRLHPGNAPQKSEAALPEETNESAAERSYSFR